MPNLSSIEGATTTATALSGLILVSPQAVVGYQPQNPPNPNGESKKGQTPPAFLFNYEGEQSVTLESDITDHFVEKNIVVEDQIALRPEEYTVHGFIGELNDVVPDLLKPLKIIADKLIFISAFEPELTTTALIAYNNALLATQIVENAANAGVSAWSGLSNFFGDGNGQNTIGAGGLQPGAFDPATGKVTGVQNKQQTAFQQLYGYWRLRYLFTIQTPWAVFENMAIKRLRAVQDADTRMITDFEVTFKMIRTATTADVFATFPSQGRAVDQQSGIVNNGTSKGADVPTSYEGSIDKVVQ